MSDSGSSSGDIVSCSRCGGYISGGSGYIGMAPCTCADSGPEHEHDGERREDGARA